jgi:hypothetical protein
MVSNVFTQALTFGIPVAFVFGITYPINLWLVKKKKMVCFYSTSHFLSHWSCFLGIRFGCR